MNANNKYSKGYATTGVGMCVCARHGFVQPNAVGDLQKGERYVTSTMSMSIAHLLTTRFSNIDYLFCATYAQASPGVPKVVSYDIACQWMPHLIDRIKALPDHIRVELPVGEVRYAIPKYHFAGHKKKDHAKFSLNYLRGVGRTDGEQIERDWSEFDEAAGCTREMGPGSRHDTLEDHFGWSNWQKLVGLSMYSSMLATVLLIVHRSSYTEETDSCHQGPCEIRSAVCGLQTRPQIVKCRGVDGCNH